MVYQAAWKNDQKKRHPQAYMAKLFAGETSFRVVVTGCCKFTGAR
jgi:hypothetical protein